MHHLLLQQLLLLMCGRHIVLFSGPLLPVYSIVYVCMFLVYVQEC